MGHGITTDLYDLLYVKPDAFQAAKNPLIASEIEKINRKLIAENRHYVLVGLGRWGSADPWLGIPVKWSNISHARLIVESGLSNYRVDPSQGTHFFQNLTSTDNHLYNLIAPNIKLLENNVFLLKRCSIISFDSSVPSFFQSRTTHQ